MGDISIIARRLSDQHVQHGWSGNGGHFSIGKIALGAKAGQHIETIFW